MTARLISGLYYLSLGAWFGAIVLFAIAAAVTFKTLRAHEVSLNEQPYNQPQITDAHSDVLAGLIVGRVIWPLRTVQWICAITALACVLLQCTIFAGTLTKPTGLLNGLRIALIVGPTLLLAVDQFYLAPRMAERREAMYDTAVSAEARQKERDVFMGYHRVSEKVAGVTLLLVAGAVIISPFVLHVSMRR